MALRVHVLCHLVHAVSTLAPAAVVFAAEETHAWGVVHAAAATVRALMVGYAAMDVDVPAMSSPVVSAVDFLVVSSVVVPVVS